jgi:hypothetical protein
LNLPNLDFVHITPDPALSELVGTNQRMLCLVEMFGGVLVLGRVATTHMSTSQTQAQMHPGIAGLNTFLTYMYGRGFDFDLIEVLALGRHRFLIFPFLNLNEESSLWGQAK